MKRVLFLITLLLIFFLLLFHKAEAKDTKDYVSLSLTNTVSVKKYKDLKVYYEPYTVKEGEWLWKILRDRYKVPLYQRLKFLDVIKRLNPTISNENEVYPGQKIFIPLKLEAETEQTPVPEYKPTSKQEDKSAKELLTKPSKAEGTNIGDKSSTLTVVKDKAAPVETEKLLPLLTESSPKDIKDFIGTIFINTGDRYINKGNYYIPIHGGGELTLDSETFPILEMKNGGKIIIVDVDNHLPAKIEKLVESSWNNYKILNIQKDDSVESIFKRLFALSGNYSIIKSDKPLTLKDNITTTLWSDWVISEKQDSPSKNMIYVVNIVDGKEKATPQTIKDYLKMLEVSVINVSLDGKKESLQDQRKAIIGETEEVISLNSSNHNELIRSLLALVNQSFTTEVKLPLSSESKSIFNLEFMADILLKRGDLNYIISLNEIPDDLAKMLIENKLTILAIQKDETQESVISKVLDFVGVKSSFSTCEFDTIKKGTAHNITIAIPGFLLQGDNLPKTLITKANVDKNISSFLKEKGIRAVRY